MIKVGITGGIGSGKSIVSKIFSLLEIPIFDADSEAKKIMSNDAELIQQLKNSFGTTVYNSVNELNRAALADIIFNNEEALQKINSIVHPAVNKHFESWVNTNLFASYIIKEAAILFESGSAEGLDYIITVMAPEKIRFKRVMERDNVSLDYVQSVAKNQMSDEDKKTKSNFIIVNDETSLVIPQVIKLHNFFLSLKNIQNDS